MLVNIDLSQSRSISFICTHLDHRQDDSERVASANAIRAELSSLGSRPAILAGDLNATPDSEVLQAFRVDWTPSNMDERPTIPVDKPTQQIDFVLFRPVDKWKVIETKVLPEAVASDHRAIFAQLELNSDQ